MFEQIRKLRNRLVGGTPQAPVEYYVSPDGNNIDGLSLGNAFTTITKGIDVLNNLPASKKGAVLWIAPGTYIEEAGIELETDFNIIRCIQDMIGRVYWVGSGEDGSVTPALDNLLKITGRYNIISGFTLFNNSTEKADLKFEDKSGGGGYGGQNLIEKCFFNPFNEDLTKYCVDIFGGARNIFRKCIFDGPSVAGIYLKNGWGAPINTIIEECNFIGTNRGVTIDGENYNTLIRKNWFTPGSKAGENMDNAIELTANFALGKVIVYENYFEQNITNDILDNKTGSAVLIEMNNFNGT
jgi:hypothetical protein